MNWRKLFPQLAGVALVMMALASHPACAAAPWYVASDGDDDNDCLSPATACATINGAIGKAGPGDTVYVSIGTYTGSGDEVVLLDKSVTLSGGWDATFTMKTGTSTIDGEGARRGMTVNGGQTVIAEHFAICNGSADDGAGVYNAGTLSLNKSSVSGNTGDGSFSRGGGLINDLGGHLTLDNSTVSGNTARGGGGILNYADSTLTLIESTVSDNSAYAPYTCGDGGGINNAGTLRLTNSTVSGNTAGDIFTCSGGGILNTGTAVLNNSTISDNTAGSGGGIYNDGGTLTLNSSTVSGNAAGAGGGIGTYLWAGTVTLQNSVVAGNMASEISPDCDGPVGSSGHNLIGDTSDCTFTPANGDLTNVDVRLGPMQDNGGPTPTHALLPDSPAIDAGDPAGCTDEQGNVLAFDQRGFPRRVDGDGNSSVVCDMGAYEFGSFLPFYLYLPIVVRSY